MPLYSNISFNVRVPSPPFNSSCHLLFYFKTRFQNDGEGPAKTIRLETDIPEMFDKKTLQIVDSYPKCPICPKGENVTYSCIDTIINQKEF